MSPQANKRPLKGSALLTPLQNYTVVDLETTGFSPYSDEIVEIGALKVRNNQIVDRFHSLINVNKRIPYMVSEKTGISNNMLYGSPYLPQILPGFLKFVGQDDVLGHNVHFDINFLYDNCLRINNAPFANNFMDFVRVAKKVYTLPNYQLGTIAAHLDIDASGAHRAVDDCVILHQCYTQSLYHPWG